MHGSRHVPLRRFFTSTSTLKTSILETDGQVAKASVNAFPFCVLLTTKKRRRQGKKNRKNRVK